MKKRCEECGFVVRLGVNAYITMTARVLCWYCWKHLIKNDPYEAKELPEIFKASENLGVS